MKRVFDFTLSLIGLLFSAPVLLLTALGVWILDGRPVFFRQERIGRGGRPFRIFKFRTMRSGSAGPMISAVSDQRITPVGRVLRKTKLDELPQLLNVLRGDMSFVGPRPDVAHHIAMYSASDRRVLDLVPGITGAASLVYSREGEILAGVSDPLKHYESVIMPHKNAINLRYAARANFLTDILLIFFTVVPARRWRKSYLQQFL